MLARVRLAVAVVLACASVCGSLACVGDDTVVEGTPEVQGGSGPAPSSYDATVDAPGWSSDAAPDALDATNADAGGADSATDARFPDARPDANETDASDANTTGDAGDAGDAE